MKISVDPDQMASPDWIYTVRLKRIYPGSQQCRITGQRTNIRDVKTSTQGAFPRTVCESAPGEITIL